jgi:hypothetical protein
MGMYAAKRAIPEIAPLCLLQEGAIDVVAYFSVNARISNLVGGAEVAGNNFCILGIPLREVGLAYGITLLVPSTSQPLYVSENFEVSPGPFPLPDHAAYSRLCLRRF